MVYPAVPELTPGYPPVAVAIRPAAMASLSRPGGSTQTLWRRPPASTLSPEASVPRGVPCAKRGTFRNPPSSFGAGSSGSSVVSKIREGRGRTGQQKSKN